MIIIDSINPISFDNGPGIRVEVNISDKENGISLTPNQLVDRIRKFRPYFELDGGGVTFKSKNIFMYSNYINNVCKICHKAGINTCIQTEEYDFINNEEVFENIDLFIIFANELSMDKLVYIEKLINELYKRKVPIWIKLEVNDKKEYIDLLKENVKKYDNIKNINVFDNT